MGKQLVTVWLLAIVHIYCYSVNGILNNVFPTYPRKFINKILNPINIFETVTLFSKTDPKIKCSMLCSENPVCKTYAVNEDKCQLYAELEIIDSPSPNQLEVALKMNFSTFNNLGMKNLPDLEQDILVLRHNRTDGLFPTGQTSINSDNPSAPLYSILDQIANYGDGQGFFRFKLCIPEISSECFLWKQSDNPMEVTSRQPEANYIFESGPDEFHSEFRGLWRLDDSKTILNGGIVGNNSPPTGWWWALGQRTDYNGAIPAYVRKDGAYVTAVYLELYVRVPL